MPFFLGIGNHETIPPKTRDEFVATFADWLNAPEIREQVRYALPPDAAQAKLARTHVYGYLLATVSAPGAHDENPIDFEFQEITEAAVPTEIGQRFGFDFLHHCYQENAQN